jgi:hypothetical protein
MCTQVDPPEDNRRDHVLLDLLIAWSDSFLRSLIVTSPEFKKRYADLLVDKVRVTKELVRELFGLTRMRQLRTSIEQLLGRDGAPGVLPIAHNPPWVMIIGEDGAVSNSTKADARWLLSVTGINEGNDDPNKILMAVGQGCFPNSIDVRIHGRGLVVEFEAISQEARPVVAAYVTNMEAVKSVVGLLLHYVELPARGVGQPPERVIITVVDSIMKFTMQEVEKLLSPLLAAVDCRVHLVERFTVFTRPFRSVRVPASNGNWCVLLRPYTYSDYEYEQLSLAVSPSLVLP